jgi:ribose 5-phosphate isomerase B
MHLYIGSDHAGFSLKQHLVDHLTKAGHTVLDQGTKGPDSVDYPDFAHAVAKGVTSEEGSLGIVVCGSGNGVNITANKHEGIRSALAWTPEIGALARQHNNANILALPARFITSNDAERIVEAFLNATFEGGRHQGRVDKIETKC